MCSDESSMQIDDSIEIIMKETVLSIYFQAAYPVSARLDGNYEKLHPVQASQSSLPQALGDIGTPIIMTTPKFDECKSDIKKPNKEPVVSVKLFTKKDEEKISNKKVGKLSKTIKERVNRDLYNLKGNIKNINPI